MQHNDGSQPEWVSWSPGEPNDEGLGGYDADCVVLEASGLTLLDRECKDRYPFLCQEPCSSGTPMHIHMYQGIQNLACTSAVHIRSLQKYKTTLFITLAVYCRRRVVCKVFLFQLQPVTSQEDM